MTGATFELNLDRLSTARSVLELRFLARQVGDRPHVAEAFLRRGMALREIVPPEAAVVGTYQCSIGAFLLAESPEYVLFVESWGRGTNVTVAADSPETAVAVRDRLAEIPGEKSAPDGVRSAIWRCNPSGGGSRTNRVLQTTSWRETEDHYPQTVGRQLESLMCRDGVSDGEGRLILFHGEPGVGKTTAIRALMQEWSPWCETHVVTDPDRLFGDANYLMEVMESDEGKSAPTLDRPPGDPKWKLVVAEDADAYLRSTARLDAGTALGRLLNATDGLLGQSTKTLILLTTNEELTRLHPALIRPGRCLARIEFLRFPHAEARKWLGDSSHPPSDGATLAELFEARRTDGHVNGQGVLTGTYL